MIVDLLAQDPLLVLFLVAGGGYLIGRIRIRGFSLGVVGVLLTGLAVGAVDPRLRLPEIVYLFGLVLFVYTMGLSAGPNFLTSLRRTGLWWNVFALVCIAVVAAAVALVAVLRDLGGPTGAGLFTGVLTNTPALAAVVERLRGGPDAELPVVAYSLAYPASVISCLVAITVLQRWWRVDYRAEAASAGMVEQQLRNATVEVHRAVTVGEVIRSSGGRAIIGRVRHGEQVTVGEPELRLEPGDLVTVVGERDAVADVTRLVGQATGDRLDADRLGLDMRRVFVSNSDLVGRRLGELDLAGRFGAIVTRIRRGDTDLLAEPSTVLELGDRVRVLAPPDRMRETSRYFGDSYKELGELNVASLCLGLALGLLLGLVSVPVAGVEVSLGFAGGPLVVGLVLGARRRTGPIVWQLPATVNHTLRQLGLVMFLGAIGTRAGGSFVATITTAGGWLLLGAATLICLATAFGVLVVAYRVLGWPMGVATGLLAAICTQPATLAFAEDQTHDELPERSYTAVYPISMLAKILIAQLLLTVL